MIAEYASLFAPCSRRFAICDLLRGEAAPRPYCFRLSAFYRATLGYTLYALRFALGAMRFVFIPRSVFHP
jgi:hypothetical protein